MPTTGRSPLSEPLRHGGADEPVDVHAAADPVAAVLAAHAEGRRIALRTSGSTREPRAVTRTTRSWFDSLPTVAALTALDERSRLWVPGPVGGTMNLFALVLAHAAGAAVVDQAGRATHAHLTPTALRQVLGDSPETLGGLILTVAGDTLPRVLHDEAVSAGAVVTHYYGAAELSFVAWGSHAEDLLPFPGVEVEVREGQVWVRSPYLADVETVDGYATVRDRGEWVVAAAEDGTGPRLRILGRGDLAVVTGGVTVPVEPVETVLRRHARGDVVVVASPHPDLGEVVAAVLTDATDLGALVASARTELEEAHRPRLWFGLASMPVGPGGKVDRAGVRSLVARGETRRLSVLRSVPGSGA